MLKVIFLYLIVVIIGAFAGDCDDPELLIVTNSGPVQGVWKKPFFDQSLSYGAWLGVPYAESPTENLRFKAPEKVKKWTETKQTTKYPPGCLRTSDLMHITSPRSEDCLFLNIYKPSGIPKKQKLPVIFFIHGGAFFDGDGSNQLYGADLLMDLKSKIPNNKNKNVIYVTINYRLGPFGFLDLDEKDYTGNMGFKDQRLALEWVHENIELFGGDKNCISVFGQSAGAVSAHLQVLYEAFDSNPKIKHASIISGSAYVPWAINTENHREVMFKTFESELGGQKNVTLLINKVLKLNATEILTRPFADVEGLSVTYTFAATIENKSKATRPFLTESPPKIYANMAASKQKFKTEVMFGITSTEMIFSDPLGTYDFVNLLNPKFDVALPYRLNLSGIDTDVMNEVQQKIRKCYFKNDPIEANEKCSNAFAQLHSDVLIAFGVYDAAKQHAFHGKTYFCMTDVDLKLNYLKMEYKTPTHGMGHCEDLMYFLFAENEINLYKELENNPNDPKNAKTLAAMHSITGFYVDFAHGYDIPLKYY